MKTFYVDIDQSITELLTKIESLHGKNILLVIPKGSALLRNAVNLKVLKKKGDEYGKNIQIFTNDEKAKKVIRKAGIKIYEGVLRKRKKKNTTAQVSELPEKAIRRIEKKVSITDVSQKTQKANARLNLSNPQKKAKRREQREWTKIFLFNTLRKKTTLAFTGLALFFFMVILYITVPSATVYLTPASNVIDKTINITLADPARQGKVLRNPSLKSIPMIPIEIGFEKSMLYQSTGKVFTGKSARCNLKIINERNTPWTLIPKSRFQSPTGVVFRIKEQVVVPAARFQMVRDENNELRQQKNPGTLIASVTADEFDANQNVVGERGNLQANTPFKIPALSEFNQSLLYATNEKPCAGGITDFYRYVTEDDVKAAQQKMKEDMESSARQYLVDFVDGENVKRAKEEQEGTYISQLLLFDHPQAIKYEDLKIVLPNDIENQQVDEFSIRGKMTVRGAAYEQQPYFDLLEEGLLSKVHPSKVLSDIDYDSTTFSIVYTDSDLEDLSKIKLSITVRGLEEYNFNPKSDQGKLIIDQILGYVPGKTKLDASYFISNLEPIQKSDISIWPFWKSELPTRSSSISIRIQ